MVLVIVSRNIDLSVGSVVGFIGMSYALLMANVFPTTIGVNHPLAWVIALALGVLLGIIIGGFQGFLIAYLEIPSFVVTLGGLFLFRGLIWQLSGGPTIAPGRSDFILHRRRPRGIARRDARAGSFGIVIAVAAVYLLVSARRQRQKFGFPLRPMWAEVLIGVVAIGVVLGGVYVANSYHWPAGLATQYAAKHGITEPPGGLQIEAGIPFPLVILIGVTIVDDVPRDPAPLRPRHLRLRREPGGGRARGHQHALDRDEDLHPHGDPVRDQRRHRVGPPERRNARPRDRLRAVRHRGGRDRRNARSRAASGRSRARSSARWSCSRSSTA